MKTKNYFLLLVFLIGFGLSVQAKRVVQKDAEKAAINYYYERLNQFVKTVNYDNIVIKDIFVKTHNGEAAFYAFDFVGGGFVIVAAEDVVYPIIGYSYQGNFPVNAKTESNYGSFIQTYIDEIVYARQNNVEADSYVENTWKHLLLSDIANLQTDRSDRDVEPLLSSLWNQDNPYNLDCPEDENGPGGHVYAGCVATAMAMVMHYWRYPLQGEGEHSYYAEGYGTQYANFGETDYEWTGMKNQIDNIYPWAITLLQYHCGVSVDMQYSPYGSGAYSYDADDALRNYFNYDDAVYRQKSSYGLTEWKNMLKENLDDGKPMHYSGRNTSNEGHAFVCDGYQEDNFHFNFGWSGSGNGFYSLYDVNGFYRSQSAIMNFYPTDPDYPYYASGQTTVTTLSGSITDGSGPVDDYKNNQSASWLIDPQTEEDSVVKISVAFSEFELEDNDEIYLYDGESTEDSVLGHFSGSNPPEMGNKIYSTGNKMLITFDANDMVTDKGFYLEYTSVLPEYCDGLVILLEPTGDFSDGSGSFYYINSSTCMWSIEPEWASNITLYFDSFDTEQGEDYVKVYDGTTNLIGTFSGDEIPDPLTASSGQMLVVFSSDSWINHPGWEAYYEIDNVSVEENDGFTALSVYPNPANDLINIKLVNEDNEACKITLASITGKTVFEQEYENRSDQFETAINVNNLNQGVYILTIQTDTKSTNKKIVID